VVYQNVAGSQRAVSGQFVLRGPNEVGFSVGGYDPGQPLVIDPVLTYSTFLGGSAGLTEAHAVAVDPSGDAYVTGKTASPNYPTSPGAFQTGYGGGVQDAFVTKFSANGSTLLYSRYLGGSSGDVAYTPSPPTPTWPETRCRPTSQPRMRSSQAA